MGAPAALVLFLAWQSNFYSNGLKALEEKRYSDAVGDLTNAVAAEPSDFTAHFNLALALSLTGNNADAAAEYRKTLDLKPGLYQAQLNLGIVLLRLDRPAEAKDPLAAAVAQKPQDFRANYHYGEALLAAQDYPGAEHAFIAAASADPKSAGAELGLARALARQNRLPDAAPHFQKAAALNPQFHDELLELASLYESAKQYNEAAALYAQFPADPAAQEHLGEMLLASGKPGDAIKQFEAAVAASPTTANRAALADAYLANHQPASALPIVQQLLQSDPNDFTLLLLSGHILRDQRKFPDAAAQFVHATQIDPASAAAWNDLAVAFNLAGNDAGALAALDRLRALHAEKPGHLFERAIILDKVHDLKPALAAYREFLSAAAGKYPDEEFKARQRARIIEDELNRR